MLALIGCGDNSRECGIGTELVNGVCQGAQCGIGTIADEQGQCVPDGSVVCTDGTTFDVAAGVCVADITACGPNLVIFEGECRDAADIDADYYEPAEPNDGMNGTPSAVDIAPEGEAITIQGCVAPTDTMPDGDTYVITTTGPTLLDVMVDGYNGLAGAFMLESNVMMLNQNQWIRFGLNLFNDTAHRHVYLPAAGEYWLTVTDARSILDGVPAGNGDTCYLTTITTLAMPTPLPASGLIVGELNGEAMFYEYTAVEGDVVFVDAEADNNTVLIDAVLMANNQYFESSSGNFDQRPLGSPASSQLSGLAAGDQVVVVIDPVIDYGIDTAQYQLRMNSANPQPLPGDGTTTTVTDNDQEVRYLYFDVEAGDVVHIRFAADAPGGVRADIVDPDLNIVTAVCNGCSSYDDYVYFTEAARYYLALTDLSVPTPPSFQLTGERIHHTPAALAVGTALTGEALNTDGSTFYTLDFNAIDWVAYTGMGVADFIGDLELVWYPRTRSGGLGKELGEYDRFALMPPPPPFSPEGVPNGEVGRIYDAGSTFLIRARDNGFLVGDPGSFDMAITQRPFTHLGVIDGINPVEAFGVPIGAGELQRFIVEAPVFSDATVQVGGVSFDTIVTEYDRYENETIHDTGLVDDPEIFDVKVVPSAFIAFGVRESFGDPGSYDIIINGVLPPMQVIAGNLPFISVCPEEGGGGVLMTTTSGSGLPADDEGFTELFPLPFAYEFLQSPVTNYTVSTNGFLTFDGTGIPYDSFSIPPIPDPALPNAYIAPLWADLEFVRICVLETATEMTVQIDGAAWFVGTPAHLQLRLHDDNSMDFIYAENHVLSSASASIGLENLAGDSGFQMGYGSIDELATAGSSWTLVPN